MRVVLDTNVLVRANPKTSPAGLARDLLMTIATGPHTLVLSQAILGEVQRVLTYPRLRERWPLTLEVVEQYVRFLVSAGELVDVPFFPAAVVEDPDDDPILGTAVSGRADVLCTRDAAFRHVAVVEICVAHGIRILDDVALMKELRLYHSESE